MFMVALASSVTGGPAFVFVASIPLPDTFAPDILTAIAPAATGVALKDTVICPVLGELATHLKRFNPP